MPGLAVVLTIFVVASTIADVATVADKCVLDLEAIPDFLLENDTGAKSELAQWGQAHFETALARSREDALRAQDRKTCLAILTSCLKAWRRGHLEVIENQRADTQQTDSEASADLADRSLEPSMTLLSRGTLLLAIPSFETAFRAPLVDLIAKQRRALGAHGNRTLRLAGLQAKACVTATAKDALKPGYAVEVYDPAIACVSERSRTRALARLERRGVLRVRALA